MAAKFNCVKIPVTQAEYQTLSVRLTPLLCRIAIPAGLYHSVVQVCYIPSDITLETMIVKSPFQNYNIYCTIRTG